ncbi:MAG: thiamine phosphate synthase [Smithellaceae bacterium]
MDQKCHLPPGSLYLVLSESYGKGRHPLDIARRAIDGGVDILQMREKDKTTDELLALGASLRRLCRQSGVVFIVNDDPELACRLDADGVHLGQEDLALHGGIRPGRM